MNIWFAKSIVLLCCVLIAVIRAPHGGRSRTVKVAVSRKGRLETVLLTIAIVTYVMPIIWVVSPLFSFAEYPLRLGPYVAGILIYALAFWIFFRSHADLGTNWSVTLEVREEHRLITDGVYRRIRHPMYLALLLYGLGQTLVLPNWVVGPSYLAAMIILFIFRLGPEERMMIERFGEDYEEYRRRSKRLIPGVW